MGSVLQFLAVLLAAFGLVSLGWLAAGALLGMDVKNGWRIFRRDRYSHASPNSAQGESACAGALGIRLAGDAWYFGVLCQKPTIGDALREIEPEDILRVNRLMYTAVVLALTAGCAVVLALDVFLRIL